MSRQASTPAPDGTILSFSGVSKQYRHGHPVLNNVDLSVGAGQLVQVRGSNGSGKSTLLRLAVGSSRPTSGNIRRHTTSVGFVPDQTGMLGTLTANAYLSHLARISGLRAVRARSRIGELQHLFGVRPGLREPISVLSKGNRQKVLLMQAFLAPADLIVMDEPTTALDSPAISALHSLLTATLHNGAGILIASHGDDFDDIGRSYDLQAGQLHVIPDSRIERPATTALTPSVAVKLTGTSQAFAAAGRALDARLVDGAGSEAVFQVPRASLSEFLRAALDSGCEVVSITGVDL